MKNYKGNTMKKEVLKQKPKKKVLKKKQKKKIQGKKRIEEKLYKY